MIRARSARSWKEVDYWEGDVLVQMDRSERNNKDGLGAGGAHFEACIICIVLRRYRYQSYEYEAETEKGQQQAVIIPQCSLRWLEIPFN